MAICRSRSEHGRALALVLGFGLGVVLCASVSALTPSAAAADIHTASRSACAGKSFTWTGNADGSSWGDAGNWSPNGDPGTCAADSVVIGIEANIVVPPRPRSKA